MSKLEGKVAVITGGTRGFGLAMAEAFTREGAAVVLASRSDRAVGEAVARLQSQGGRAAGLAADAADSAQVEALAEHALHTFGKIDVWINNAALSAPYGPTVEISAPEFVRVTETNVLGVYYGSMAALRIFLRRGSGKLINILGRGDRNLSPLQNAYASSKAWVRSFTLNLAKETKGSGVGVYAFNPGMMETALLQDLEAVEGYEGRLKVMPTIIRMWALPPERPAEKAVWLASSATDGRTGLEVHVMSPGGMLAGAMREGAGRLFRRPLRQVEVKVRTVPSALPNSGKERGAA